MNQADKEMFAQLKAEGITEIEIEFAGSGDEGQIEEIKAFVGEEVVGVGMLESQLDEWAYDYVCNTAPFDWVNNEGGAGTLHFNLETGHAKITGGVYETELHELKPVEANIYGEE